MTEEKQEITPEQAREVLRARAQADLQQCGRLIQATLDRFNARIVVDITITADGRIVGRSAIVPRENVA